MWKGQKEGEQDFKDVFIYDNIKATVDTVKGQEREI